MLDMAKKRKIATSGGTGVYQNNYDLVPNFIGPEVVDTRPPWFDESAILKNCTPKEQLFVKKAIKINSTNNGFTFQDFPELRKDNFRQIVSRLILKGVVIRETRDLLGYYRVKGVPMSGDRRKMLADLSHVDSFYDHLVTMSVAPSGIHDIMLEFKSKLLHQKLKAKGRNPHASNSLIKTGIHFGPYLYANIQVYPKTVEVHIKSSQEPFGCDPEGMDKLMNYGRQIYDRLLFLCDNETDFPPPEMWIVTLYHFGRDGRTYSGEKYQIRFTEFVGGIAYFYIKDWQDGKKRPRLDQICTPHSPLKEIIEQKFRSQEKNLENVIHSLQKEEEHKTILEEFRKKSEMVEKIMQSH